MTRIDDHALRDALLAGPGEARRIAREIDWGATPIGAVERWPRSLRVAARLCLDSRTPMAIWAGPAFTLLYNDGYAPVLGPDKHPWAMGRPGREVWPEVWGAIGPEFRDVIERGISTRHEDTPYRLRRRGGDEEAFFTYCLTPIREEDGRIVGVLNVAEETTRSVRARTETEEKLERERARLQAILDTIPVGLFISEAGGNVVATNDAARRIWAGAVPLEKISDYSEYVGYWPDTGARLQAEDWAAAQALLHGRRTEDLVVDIDRFDGTKGTIVLSGAPILDERGHTIGAVSAIQDISELRTAQARLEEADRRKDHFLAVLSHELRNPLAPIKNSLYLLDRAAPGSDRARRAKAVVDRQVDQLCHLVDDLLDVTRIARGKVQLRRARLELNDLVRRAIEDHRGMFEGAGVAVELETAPAPIHVDADSGRVAQVIGNLLQNAAKFTPPGGRVAVSVSADGAARPPPAPGWRRRCSRARSSRSCRRT